jgi:hypothetical protein
MVNNTMIKEQIYTNNQFKGTYNPSKDGECGCGGTCGCGNNGSGSGK